MEKRSRDQPLNHEFIVILDTDFRAFILRVDQRIEVANKIARALGDRLPTYVRITRLVAGSVTFCWTNSSLLSSDRLSSCPVQVSNSIFQTVMSFIYRGE